MTLRPIGTEGIKPLSTPTIEARGPAPMLQWISISELVVDDDYQRTITKAGRKTINKIIADFRWSRFAPVIVSPIAGGKFAIVDGQHRTTAALIVGIEAVPCQVVLADPAEQAAAFSAINGNVTRIHLLALHRAAVAAGDPEAVAIDKAATKAGVRILPYPKSELHQEPGETLAIGTLADCLRTHGENLVVISLRCITETRNRVRGGLLSAIIAATVDAVSKLPPNLRDERLIAAFERINVIREFGKSQGTVRSRGTSIRMILAGRLSAALSVELRSAA